MPLLKDLITIPERVHQGDFVPQLTEGMTEPEQTLRDDVVTPQLVDIFSNALGYIRNIAPPGDVSLAFERGAQ